MSHGGSFKKFNGLKTHRSNYIVGEPTYPGKACIHSKHSESSTSRCWRDSKTHACLMCLEDIEKREFALNLDRFNAENRKQALKFWSKVEITNFDDCWQWTGDLSKGQLYFFWKRPEMRNRYQWHPIVVSMWLSWGDTGRLGSESVCGNRRCMNPLHNLPVGLIPSIRVADYDDQWLRNELETLKSQVAQYQQSLAAMQAKQLEGTTIAGINTEEERMNSERKILSPYQLAFSAMQKSLVDGSHSMLSK